uniref:EGF-like domain-containing protein n=1 Tax=Steinernema glaseri TaxID=37863 RepID=A0A1I7Y5M3_9BILA
MEADGVAIVNDNKPHLVELRRYNNQLKVLVDEREDSQFTIDRPFNHPLLADQVLVGSDESGRFFKGSLQDVRVNDKNLLLQENMPSFQVEPFGQVVSRKKLLKGTVSDDVCTDIIPCVHGTCQNTFNDYECQCNRGWMGRNCEVKDFCVDSQCPEHASCVNTHGGFICKSTATFYKTSFIKYRVSIPPSSAMARNYNVSFSVRTRSTNGQLLRLQSSSESLSISFTERRLLLAYSNQSDTVEDELEHMIVDGDWHTVTLSEDFDTQRLLVAIDAEEFRATTSNGFSLKHFVMDRGATVSVGRSENASSFEGCLRDFGFSPLPEFSFLSRSKFGGHLDGQLHFVPESRENVVATGCQSTEQCGRVDPCKNGASCRDLFNLRRCDCLPGFEGELCEKNVDECALLGAESCGAHGQSSSESLSLSFAERRLVLAYSNQSDTVEDELEHLIVDGDWHTVTLSEDFDTQRLLVSIDAEEFRATSSNGFSLKHFVMDRGATVSVGRSENASSFEGCLRDFGFSPLPEFSFLSRSKFGGHLEGQLHFVPESRENVVATGCQSTEQCGRVDPCKNGASCRDLFNLRRCDCLPGFEGDLCEKNVDECAQLGSESCGAHGVCVDGIGTHTCRCETGFTGEKCDQPVDLCKSDPCENGGKCAMVGGRAVCQCEAPFVGSRCQQRSDVNCSADPCAHKSECFDLSE